MRRYTIGDDVWGVWICDLPPTGNTGIEAAAAANALTDELVPYFAWLSGGAYRLRFVPAGEAVADPADTYPCETQIEQLSDGRANGALVISDERTIPPAYAHPDTRSPAAVVSSPNTFPNNGRIVRICDYHVLPDSPHRAPNRIAHEIGHALGWPHSYQHDGGYQYDNPLDVMSGELAREEDLDRRPQGTPAINRFAAGWIDPAQVTVYSASATEYRLGPIGSPEPQLLILPTGIRGPFVALDVRVGTDYDTGMPRGGVTVHEVDQRSEACDNPTEGGCFGHKRRTRPVVADNRSSSTPDHVLEPGDSVMIGSHLIGVLDRHGDVFRVRVTEVA